MCDWGNQVRIDTTSGRFFSDRCMVVELLLVRSLGIITLNHCCGHGKAEGEIIIEKQSNDIACRLGYSPRYFSDDSLTMFRLPELPSPEIVAGVASCQEGCRG
jgi:hypothetical protein